MNILIRPATPNDMQQVHDLVKQLAEFEKMPMEVSTTAQIFEKDLLASFFEAIVAEDLDLKENNIVGLAIYYYAYSTWKGKYLWLEDFVVKEELRGKGIGKMLFEEIHNIAKKQDMLLKWQVLDWNEPAIQFYKKYNAEFLTDWVTCRLKK